MSLKRIKLVISDIHLGEGQKPGMYNPWHNFHNDKKLCDFLEYYSTGDYGDECEVELIIAGDFIDFLQIKYNDEFPLIVTEDVSLEKLEKCIKGHKKVWESLCKFITKPGKTITILPGNHDLDLYFPKVRKKIIEYIGGKGLFHKVNIHLNGPYIFDNIWIQHGHEFEITNSFEDNEITFINQDGEEILNLPWGSYYHILVLNPLKIYRPYIDRIRPLKLYFLGAIFLDTKFALKFIHQSLKCLIKTRFTKFLGKKRSFKNTLKILKESFYIFASLERFALKIFNSNPQIKVVIFGHSHIPRVRKIKDKLYFNSGTWTHSINLHISALGTQEKMTYILINYENNNISSIHLMEWHGFYNIKNEILF